MNMAMYKRIAVWCLAIMLCFTTLASANVSKGSKGNEVSSIQHRLIDLGYLSGNADGQFGNKTEQAVIAFQNAMGIPATGVVDDYTWNVLFDPNLHTPYFQNTMLFLYDSYIDSNGNLNQSGGKVYWLLEMVIPQADWMDGSVPDFSYSWTDEPIHMSDGNYQVDWEIAKKGKTSGKWYFGYWWDKQDNEYNAFYYDIALPDDPKIAGRQWIEMECMGDKAIVFFTIEYKGSYTDGTGWRIQDISFENIKSEISGNKDVEVRNDGFLSPHDALMKMNIVEGYGLPYDPNDNEYYTSGRNNKDEEVMYGITTVVEQSPAEVHLSAVSWTDNYLYDQGLEKIWEEAKRGNTAVVEYSDSNNQSDETKGRTNAVFVSLPDNPSISGEQWLMLSCDDQRALVRINLTYRGNYETGTGWSVEYLGTSVNKVG